MKARLPQGMGGGSQNVNTMIRQAQKMQTMMQEKQEEISGREFKAAAGGGAIEVVVNGKKEILAITLQPDVVDPSDIEMLQDLIIAAVNEALRTVSDVTEVEMDKITGGLSVPGLV